MTSDPGQLPNQTGPIRAALQAGGDPMAAPQWLRWRVASNVGLSVYAQLGDLPSDADVLIGAMETPTLAQEVVSSHNDVLARIDR